MKRWSPLLPVFAAALLGFALSATGLLWGAVFGAFNAFTHPRVFFSTGGAKPRRHVASLATVAAAFVVAVWLIPDRANWLVFLAPPLASSFVAFRVWVKHAATERLFTGELRDRILAEHNGCDICGSTDEIAIDHILAWSKGGMTAYENGIPLCRKHNSAKGAKNNTLWRLKRRLTFANLRGK